MTLIISPELPTAMSPLRRRIAAAYLRDETQQIAKAYGATHTPQLFVFDAALKLAYTGSMDGLRPALNELVAGRPVSIPEIHAIGCTIKWKPA